MMKIASVDWPRLLKGFGMISAGIGILGYVIYAVSNHQYWYILNAADLTLILITIPMFIIGIGFVFDFKKPKIFSK